MLPSIFGENLFDEFFDEPWEMSLVSAPGIPYTASTPRI